MAPEGPGVSPFDTYLSSGSRFLIELTAWVAGPWAAGELLGGWAAIIALAVLLLLPSVFNTPGDKKTTAGVSTPGSIRMVIEMLLLAVAIAGAWKVWPVWLAILVSAVGGVMLVAGIPRYRWLAQGAPAVTG